MHVGQGLLHHAEQGSLYRQWQFVRFSADVEGHLEAGACGKALDETVQCRSQTVDFKSHASTILFRIA